MKVLNVFSAILELHYNYFIYFAYVSSEQNFKLYKVDQHNGFYFLNIFSFILGHYFSSQHLLLSCKHHCSRKYTPTTITRSRQPNQQIETLAYRMGMKSNIHAPWQLDLWRTITSYRNVASCINVSVTGGHGIKRYHVLGNLWWKSWNDWQFYDTSRYSWQHVNQYISVAKSPVS